MLFLDNGRSLLNEFWFIQNKFSKRVTEASVSDARQGRYDRAFSVILGKSAGFNPESLQYDSAGIPAQGRYDKILSPVLRNKKTYTTKNRKTHNFYVEFGK